MDLEMETVVTVLTQGKEIANELKKRLRPTMNSKQKCDSLVEKILSSYENALKLLDCAALLGNGDPSQIAHSNFSDLPKSEGADQNSGDQASKDVSKRRKTTSSSGRGRDQVRVCKATGFEGQLDDGYNWRKYGQKDIMGANHPRAYYRCTHRNTQGCLATKQVQRADDSSSIFEVVYRGKHSCIQDKTKRNKPNLPTTMTTTTTTAINTEGNFFSFSFPPKNESVETKLFSQPGNLIGGSYSPAFLSPTTSDSYFSLPHCAMDDFGFGCCLQSSESDFAEIISNPTPVMDVPMGGLDFSIDKMNFDPHLLDTLDCF